ncbi:endonuclease Q family protein [Melghirimyces algeriensis]|uniref:TIGR00375 family protein n=1 Tax=Melghirimyces algeriensis TaxID=910412 RepID=A0A521B1D4_9BACL|nr:endonuclease Q family protein [Melghirimyces algeriensis]SMO40859.1 TIGR00375 family protein [Melghirimyces algeriensis]
MNVKPFFADLHIHIGRTERGLPVKITGARNLTFDHIVREASLRKGMDMVGVIDAHSPPVQQEIERNLYQGHYQELVGGGIGYGHTTVILGMEIEVRKKGTGPAHLLAYFPTLDHIRDFSDWMTPFVKNMQLSTQRFHGEISALEEKVMELGGLLIPAHIFTPFKSLYGSAAEQIPDLFHPHRLSAVELGLSADSEMADHIAELQEITFLSNSDAHSLAKIGREYNELMMVEPNFQELKKVLARREGRYVSANYGLNPKLGKYYRTRCQKCSQILSPDRDRCDRCKSTKVIRGVMDRISQIADSNGKPPNHRPPYIYQVPLEFIPGLGPKTLDRLLERFGTEMDVLHRAPIHEISSLVGGSIAHQIHLARERRLEFEEGGGGIYGKVKSKKV